MNGQRYKFAAYSATGSYFAILMFYMLDYLELSDAITFLNWKTSEQIVFFIALSYFCVTLALTFGCKSEFDVFLTVIAPYAVTAAVSALENHIFLFILTMTILLIINLLNIIRLFIKRRPSKTSRKEKLRFRTNISLKFAVRLSILSCTFIMVILLANGIREKAVEQYEAYQKGSEWIELDRFFEDEAFDYETEYI